MAEYRSVSVPGYRNELTPQPQGPPPISISNFKLSLQSEPQRQSLLYPLLTSVQWGAFRIGIPVIWNGVVLSTDRLRLDKWVSLAGKPSAGDVVLLGGVRTVAEFPSSDLEWWKMVSSTRGFERLCLNPGGQYCAGLTVTINF